MSHSRSQTIAYLLPDPGIPVGGTKGASVHVESLCAALARMGARVVLYAARVTGSLRAAGSEAVQVVPIDVGEVRSGTDADSTRISAAEEFFRTVGPLLDADRPDWVYERLSLFAGSGRALCATRNLDRVVEVNAPLANERMRHFGLERAAEAHRAERSALRDSRALVVSRPLAEWALETGASEAVVVPNGADTASFDPANWAGRRVNLRRRLGFDDQVVVGFTGSLKPWHGVDVLLEALGSLSSRRRLGLLIVGDGPGRAVTEQAARALPAWVTPVLTGAVPSSAVPGYLAATDISVAPYAPVDSFYFSPLKVAEGMAAGRAVVASDFPSIRELLGTTGVLVTPGDAAHLSSSITQLVDDPETRARLGAMARARAVHRLDWDTVAARTLAFAERSPRQIAVAQGG
ncbi:MAG: glycosyltransferase family 4 protein [Acidimicrobiales bacterium]